VSHPVDPFCCPTTEVLTDYSIGNLPLSSLNAVALHLERCPHCLRSLQGVDDSLDPLLAELRHPDGVELLDEAELRPVLERLEGLCSDRQPLLDAPAGVRIGGRLGPYEILERLGEGGMGAVYKARHVHLGKLVALKVLPPERMGHADARARFLVEMKAVGRLNHRNIVLAHDAGVEDVPYLAMELLEGVDLHRLVKEHGPLSVSDACACIRQAALGLQHAHEHHLVHRDLKPSNLLLTPAGVVKILDLGLARLRSEREEADPLAPPPAAAVGSIDFIAPEQLLHSDRVDIRADLYSLGCTLYYLLTGQPPFAGAEQSMLQKQQAHLLAAPPDVRRQRGDVPAGLAAILQRLLAKTPADRPATPAETAQLLEPFAANANLRALLNRPLSASDRRPSSSGMHWQMSMTILGLFFVAMIVLAVGVVWLGESRSSGVPVSISSMDVYHFRAVPGGDYYIGSLGRDSSEVSAADDSVRMLAKLDQPAYGYLLAFHPDGTEQLCWPASPEQAPPAAAEIAYPSSGLLPLRNAGEGMYVFVLVASRRPLPAYKGWKAEHGRAPFAAEAIEGVWIYHRQEFERASPHPARGEANAPPTLIELCKFLQGRPGIDAVSALAFPVHRLVQPPNDPPNR
jgi:serine/threonine protein kinase